MHHDRVSWVRPYLKRPGPPVSIVGALTRCGVYLHFTLCLRRRTQSFMASVPACSGACRFRLSPPIYRSLSHDYAFFPRTPCGLHVPSLIRVSHTVLSSPASTTPFPCATSVRRLFHPQGLWASLKAPSSQFHAARILLS